MPTSDRRRHRRLEIRLPLIVRRSGAPDRARDLRTVTLNVSTGSLYFEIESPDLSIGDTVDLELRLPAGEGISAFEGQATTVGEVIRVDALPSETAEREPRFGVAAQFRDRLDLKY